MATTPNVPRALSAEQVKAILNEARRHSTRDWCLLLLAFRHALRSQEARTLKLADIDLENSTIAIARVKGSRSGVQSLDRHRGEPILDEVLALRSWLRERTEDGSRMLFPSQKGGAMSRMQFLRLFRKYALAMGVPADLAHPHILRHSLSHLQAHLDFAA
jgi:type 1 fimbriae regulatory protein FimB